MAVNRAVGSQVQVDSVKNSWSSEFEDDQFDFIWTLKNFSDVATINGYFLSPVFRGGPKTNYDWQLKLNPYLTNGNYYYLSISLLLLSGSAKARFQISILDNDGVVKVTQATTTPVQFPPVPAAGTIVVVDNGFPAYALQTTVVHPTTGFLIGGKTLKLHCEVFIVGEMRHTVADPPPDETLRAGRLELLSKQMKALMEKGDFETVKLETRTKTFPALKNVLAARSPVFESMFSNKMLESSKNVVKIEDFEGDAVKAMLEYMYTGHTDYLYENPEDLLRIGDKYQLAGLIEDCERILGANLDVENAARILVLGHLHSPNLLKPQVLQFMNRFRKEVQETEAFEELVLDRPALVADLYKSQ